jgi:hypothetical protein
LSPNAFFIPLTFSTSAAGAPLLEAELRVAARAAGQLLQLLRLLLDHPQLALRLPRLAGLGLEPVHELLVVRDLLLPPLDLLLPPLPLLPLLLEEGGVVAPCRA